MKDIRTVAPLEANAEPFLYGPSIPADLSTVKRSSVALVIRRSGPNYEQEVLLIKRTARPGDHWSGHLAFPGGRQDPGETDLETAVRETSEEVGLDLNTTADYLGPLDPRLIRIQWGKKLALILCPFVFSLREEAYDTPLTPQDSEVAAVFWYPLKELFNPQNRHPELVPISNRLRFSPKIVNQLVGYLVGDVAFDAVSVTPTTLPAELFKELPPTPWKLWGISWGVIQDFRRFVDPSTNVHDVILPTFTAWDLRFIVWAMSALSLRQKRRTYATSQGDWANKMLDGYFAFFPRAIVLGLVARLSVALLVARYLLKRWKK